MLLNEGGNKFNGRGQELTPEEMMHTVAGFHANLGLKPGILHPVGSVWKPNMGDIDALLMQNSAKESILQKAKEKYEHDPGGGHSFLVPVLDADGKHKEYPADHPASGASGAKRWAQLDILTRPNPAFGAWSMRHEKQFDENPVYRSGMTLEKARADVVRSINPEHKWYTGAGIMQKADDKVVAGTPESIAQYAFGDPSKHEDWRTLTGLRKHYPEIVAKSLGEVNQESSLLSFKGFLITEARVNQMNHLGSAGSGDAADIRDTLAELGEHLLSGKPPPPHIVSPKYDGSAGIVVKNGTVALAINPSKTFSSSEDIQAAYPDENRADLIKGLNHGLDYAKNVPQGHEHGLDVAGPGKLILHTVNGGAATSVDAVSTNSTEVVPAIYGELKSPPQSLRAQVSLMNRMASELPDHAGKVDPVTHTLIVPVALRAALEGKLAKPFQPSHPSLKKQFDDFVATGPKTKAGNPVFTKKHLAAVAAANPVHVRSSLDYINALERVGNALNSVTGHFPEPAAGKREGTVLRVGGKAFKATTTGFRNR